MDIQREIAAAEEEVTSFPLMGVGAEARGLVKQRIVALRVEEAVLARAEEAARPPGRASDIQREIDAVEAEMRHLPQFDKAEKGLVKETRCLLQARIASLRVEEKVFERAEEAAVHSCATLLSSLHEGDGWNFEPEPELEPSLPRRRGPGRPKGTTKNNTRPRMWVEGGN